MVLATRLMPLSPTTRSTPDLARGQDAVDLVDAVPAEPAVDETAAGQQVEARLVGGQADLAAAEADGDPDRPRLERRRLDVEHDAVAVADPGDAQAGESPRVEATPEGWPNSV